MLPSNSAKTTYFWAICAVTGACVLGACSASSDSPTSNGTGGARNTAGASNGGSQNLAGSSSSTGGASSVAGSSATGGNSSAGNSAQGGGSSNAGSGGAQPAGGTGGANHGGTSSGGTSSGGAGGTTNTGGYWKPTAGTTWQWQLTGTIDTSVDVAVYDIDGFDNAATVVKKLHDQGRKVICYLSVGSYEDWRDDAKNFPAAVLGNDYPGWPGEKFVDIRAQALRDIMAARFDICKQKGFDGIEPDNMDVYTNNSGFPLTEQDGVDYANWLAGQAHSRGLNIGQKNAPEITAKIQANFDWMLTEDCYDQGWCADVKAYVDNNKPVFMSEYTDTGVDFNAACTWGTPKKYSPILKGRDLDAPVTFCK